MPKPMRYIQRLTLAGVSCLGLFAFILVLFVREKNEQIAFREAEINGLELERPLLQLLGDVARFCLIAAADGTGPPVAAVDNGFTKLAAAMAAYGSTLELDPVSLAAHGRPGAAPMELQAEWVAVQRNMTHDQNGAAMYRLGEGLQRLVAHVADTSKLILDPEIDTFYLVDEGILTHSETLKELAGVGTVVWAVSGSGIAAVDELALISASTRLAASAKREAENGHRAAVEERTHSGGKARLEGLIGAPLARFSAALNGVDRLTQGLAESHAATALGRFSAAAVAASDASDALAAASTDALRALLEERVSAYRDTRNIGVLIGCLVFFCAAFVAFLVGRDRVAAAAEREAVQRLLEQQTKFAALGRMASGIAHEIGNPLTVIMTRTQAFLRSQAAAGIQSGEPLDTLKTIEAMSRRIREIIVGLRDLSRKEKSQDLTAESACALVTDCVDMCADRFRSENVELRVDTVPADVQLLCRPAQIGQVLTNLLTNALDAVATKRDKWVCLSFARKGDWYEFSVTDSGSGVAAEVRERLFEPFVTTKPPGKGTGLGLSISRTLVESHGGNLTLDEGSRKNTRFVVRLPRPSGASLAAVPSLVRSADMTVAPQPAGGLEPKVVVARATWPAVDSRPVILLADDDEAVRDATKADLLQLGYDVIVSTDGYHAVETYRDRCDQIDLVMLDVSMPRLTGPEAYVAIRRMNPNVRVIFCTGVSESDVPKEGVVGIIGKPFDHLELTTMLARALGNA